MARARFGMQAIDVHFGTFDYTLHVIAGPHQNVARYVGWKLDDPNYLDDFGDHRGAFMVRKDYNPILWMPRRPRTVVEYGTLSHELVHAIRTMLVDWACMSLSRESDEAFAHAMGYATREILRRLK